MERKESRREKKIAAQEIGKKEKIRRNERGEEGNSVMTDGV